MSSIETLIGSSNENPEQHILPREFLQTVFESYAELPSDKQISLDPNMLRASIDKAAAIDFTNLGEIESVEVSRSLAEYDVDTNTVFPETVTLAIKGWYTSNEFADERLIALSLTHDPIEDTYSGLVSQYFCDEGLYETSYTDASVQKLLASDKELFSRELDSPIRAVALSTQSGDFKRSATYRPLDFADLALLAEASDQAAAKAV